MESNDSINLWFVNKKYQKRPIFVKIKSPTAMYDLKMRMTKFFDRKIRHTITGFRLVKQGDPNETNDSLQDNCFDENYDNEDAYKIMEKVKKNHSYEYKQQHNTIYFRTIQNEIHITIIDLNDQKTINLPLALSNNSYDKLIFNIEENIKRKITENPFHLYQDNDQLDEISKEVDMKYYFKTGLKLFLFPIQAQFVNKLTDQKTKLIDLKFNQPLSKYLPEVCKKLNITSHDLLIQVKNENGTHDTINSKTNIHQILKEHHKEPVLIDILDISINVIFITIPFPDEKTVTTNFEYNPENIEINQLITKIQEYFNINDKKMKLLTPNRSKIEGKEYVKNYSSSNQTLILKYDESKELKMTRTFYNEKHNKEITKTFSPKDKVSSIIKQIAKEFNSDKSLIKLKIKDVEMKSKSFIGQYFIPLKQKITFEIEEFTKFIEVNFFFPIEKVNFSESKVGFTSKMTIQSFFNFLKSMHSNQIQDDVDQFQLFYVNKTNKKCIKLDHNEKFDHYGIKGDKNDIINCYDSSLYLFTYNDDICPIHKETESDKLIQNLKKCFNLDKFIIIQNGKPLKDVKKLNKNDSIFQLKKVIKMNFLINNKYKISLDSDKQVSDIISELSNQNESDPSNIQLLNDVGVPIAPDSYLYSSFLEREEGFEYKIQSREAKNICFQNKHGKFFYETFLTSMKIGDVLKELKNRGKKKIDEDSFIIYMGRVVDNNTTLSSLIIHENDEDDEKPFEIENKLPKQITVTINFQAFKNEEGAIDGVYKFIKNTSVLNVRYLASQLSSQKLDSISLIANGEMLNDDDILDKDTEITVDLSQTLSGENDESVKEVLSKTSLNISKTEPEDDELMVTQNIVQNQKKVVNDKKDDDDDELEYYDYDDDDQDIFQKGNGTYEPAPNGPEDEFIFHFKIINGEDMPLQLPKNVSVKEAKDKIADLNDTDVENITIFIGNQRLADFNKFINLSIPKTVKFFAVKIVDLQNTLICTRVRINH